MRQAYSIVHLVFVIGQEAERNCNDGISDSGSWAITMYCSSSAFFLTFWAHVLSCSVLPDCRSQRSSSSIQAVSGSQFDWCVTGCWIGATRVNPCLLKTEPFWKSCDFLELAWVLFISGIFRIVFIVSNLHCITVFYFMFYYVVFSYMFFFVTVSYFYPYISIYCKYSESPGLMMAPNAPRCSPLRLRGPSEA